MSFDEYNRYLHQVLNKLIEMSEEEARSYDARLPRIRKLGMDGKPAAAVFELAFVNDTVLHSIHLR
ncbi:hypothetical protein MK805_09880 [Shimazuella sp. AN120528]|uniref:hypothetical protein n=1 Tax=Shimazuella soli TaxID=1892854 RepID=UPI001F0D7292|nr:hypothetical protein [Shimazuella soli]MCH5585278.1 hypothetical protein [Shimazuella soli]